MCGADLFAAALRGPTYPQKAVRRPLAVSSPASRHDQGPEPKSPPSAAAEANHPAAESRAPFCVEEAPKPRAAHQGGRPSQPSPATSSGGVDTWSFQNHVGSTTTSETTDIFLIENEPREGGLYALSRGAPGHHPDSSKLINSSVTELAGQDQRPVLSESVMGRNSRSTWASSATLASPRSQHGRHGANSGQRTPQVASAETNAAAIGQFASPVRSIIEDPLHGDKGQRAPAIAPIAAAAQPTIEDPTHATEGHRAPTKANAEVAQITSEMRKDASPKRGSRRTLKRRERRINAARRQQRKSAPPAWADIQGENKYLRREVRHLRSLWSP